MSVLEYIKSMELDESHAYKNLTIHFIKTPPKDSGIITMYDATIAKVLSISELSEPDVGTLLFENRAIFPCLLPEGAVITGLRQTRGIKSSAVIDKQSELQVPVYCVEEGRWFAETKFGNLSDFCMPPRLRAASFREDSQSKRWDEIRQLKERTEKQRGEKIDNSTNCICNIYEAQRQNVDEYINAFSSYPRGAVGFIASIDEHIVQLESFGGCHRLFRGNIQGLLRALVLEALDKEICNERKRKRTLTMNQFLQMAGEARQERKNSIGIGGEIMLKGDCVIGSCLIKGRDLVHLRAFCVGG
jgi:hypothetical protein